MLVKYFFVLAIVVSALRLNAASVTQLIKPATESSKVTSPTTTANPIASTNENKVTILPTERDDQRTQQILNSLAKQAGWFPEVKITVSQGMVTISGHTDNSDQLQWLAKTADRLPSVIAVINKATIDQPAVTDFSPAWKEFRILLEKLKRSIPLLIVSLAIAAILFFLGRYLSKALNSVWAKRISNPFLLTTVSRLTMLPIWLLFFYLVLQTAGLSSLATTIIGGTGAVGIILGFAFKDIAENYLSGLLLAIRSPFTKGDEIQIENYEGYIQSLNMRGTTIIDYDGNIVLIPNSKVIQSVIRNRTSNPKTRASFTINVSIRSNIPDVQAMIYGVLKKIPAVLETPPPLVIADDITSAFIKVRVLFWYDSVKSSLFRTKSTAISQTKDILLANKIEITDGPTDISLHGPLDLHLLRTDEQVKSAVDEREAKRTGPPQPSQSEQPDDSRVDEREVQKLGDEARVMKQIDTDDLQIGP